MKNKILRIVWITIFCGMSLFVLFFCAIWFGIIGYVPSKEDMQNPIDKSASQVYSADGKVLGTYSFNKENRVTVDYSNLSTHLVEALIAIEDARFYEHSGIDFKALGRAFVKRGILQQKSAGGGSTITQQLAKQLYSKKANTMVERLFQKPIEWVIAVKLERNFTKEEIITMYLNYFDFLYNAVGIKTAANTYFSKEPKDLNLLESATLIGLCKNPSYFNPMRYPERCRERRNVVLAKMEEKNYISKDEYLELSQQDIKLNFHRTNHKDGMAPYFREFLRKYLMAEKPEKENYRAWNMEQYYIDSINWEQDPQYGWCNKNKKEDGSSYNIYTDGLRIHTTVDSRMQKYAEAAVWEYVVKQLQPQFNRENKEKKNSPFSVDASIDQIKKSINKSMQESERYYRLKQLGLSGEEIRKNFNTPTSMTLNTYYGEVDTVMTPKDSILFYKNLLRAGFLSMEPSTGAVKAYVGGVDFNTLQYDMCTLGRRQVGSTIKPFLYSMAMENGYSPCDVAPNRAQTYIVAGKPWTPKNGSKSRYGQMVTLKWGLAQSNNWISAYLMSKLNAQSFVYLLNRYGINNPNIHPSMSLCLGPCEVSVAEMVSAYTVFVNKGMRCAPQYITKIEDNSGRTIATFNPQISEVISEASSYKMLVMLKAVVDGGTAGRLRYKYELNGDIAGKTGTTNNNADAWFMGVTPQLIGGCWVGGEDKNIHFDKTSTGQGAAVALPIWALFMKKVYKDKTLGINLDAKFNLPEHYDPCAAEVSTYDNSIEEVYE